MNEDLSDYGDVCDLLDRARLDPSDPEFLTRTELISELIRFAEAGWEDAALQLGVELSSPGPDRNIEDAYRWFHIGYSWTEGYSTNWSDDGSNAPYYSGPDGDFRNEAPVCELVDEIPHGKLMDLDTEAQSWLSTHQRHV
ncbi:MAG: hypothetical protein AAGJ40_08165 [Planctomycetota bacterium]